METQLLALTQEFSDVFQQYRYRCRQLVVERALGGAASFGSREFRILWQLESEGEISFKVIANALATGSEPHSTRSSVSQAVTALWKDHKLVDKESNPADQRQPLISLTKKGEELAKRLNGLDNDLISLAMECMGLSAEEERTLRDVYTRGLEKFREKTQREPTLFI